MTNRQTDDRAYQRPYNTKYCWLKTKKTYKSQYRCRHSAGDEHVCFGVPKQTSKVRTGQLQVDNIRRHWLDVCISSFTCGHSVMQQSKLWLTLYDLLFVLERFTTKHKAKQFNQVSEYKHLWNTGHMHMLTKHIIESSFLVGNFLQQCPPVSCLVTGTFIPVYFCYIRGTFTPWNFHSLEPSFPETFAR